MKNRKYRPYILLSALAVTLACSGAALFYHPQDQQGAPLADVSAPQPIVAPAQTHRYMVRAYQGKVAVFLPEQPDSPQYVTEVDVSALPLADRTQLDEGIPIQTEEELSALLEDLDA